VALKDVRSGDAGLSFTSMCCGAALIPYISTLSSFHQAG
jgi:hypothetical protein